MAQIPSTYTDQQRQAHGGRIVVLFVPGKDKKCFSVLHNVPTPGLLARLGNDSGPRVRPPRSHSLPSTTVRSQHILGRENASS